jgi:hypothetical protein
MLVSLLVAPSWALDVTLDPRGLSDPPGMIRAGVNGFGWDWNPQVYPLADGTYQG